MRRLLLFSAGLLLLINYAALAQGRTVTGKVTSSENGTGIPGVNIVLKGTSTGTITNEAGNYSLEVPVNEGTLVFSYIGFVRQEIPLGSNSVINVQLEVDNQKLDEVVVTAVGIEANKRQLGYSIQDVKAEQLVRARETNIVSALSGKAAGVQVVSSSGSPGASANIRIRGNKSINGDNSPLFVVDGVPIDNSSSGNGTAGVDNSNRAVDINPNDIESLSILKGPAATALYGIRAANGAVIITTKRGKSGKPVITYNSAFSMERVNRLPERQSQYAQGSIRNRMYVYRGPETEESNSWGPPIAELEYNGDASYLYDRNGALVPAGTGNGVAARAYDPYEAFFVTGHTFDNNLSVSGGSERTTYYFSGGRLYQTGIIPNADFGRYSFKSTINTQLTDKLSAGMSATFINSGGNRIQRGSNVSGVMIGLLRNTPTFDIGNGKTGQDAADDPTTYALPDGTQRAYRGNGNYDNPFWSVERVPYRDNVNRIIGNVNLEYRFLPWLRLRYKLGLDHFTDRRNFGWDINSSSEITGAVEQVARFSNDLNSDLLLLIEKDISETINLNATLGHNYFSTQFINQTAEGRNLASPGFFNISNAATVQASESNSRRKLVGVFADLKLSYRNIVHLNLTGRNDWSSTLTRGNNSFFYPTASLGIEFTELLGLTNSNLLPYGKLRVSYGQVGNDAAIYSTNSYYGSAVIGGDNLVPSNRFPAFGVNAFERSSTLGNPDLKAERTSTFEVGGDFKFLRGRVGMDITYYNAVTTDQIVDVTISSASGFSRITRNAGTIENNGIEIALSATPVQTAAFTWDMNLNFTRARTIVTDLPVPVISLQTFSALSSLIIKGQPYGVLSGTRYLRDVSGNLVIGPDGWPLIDPVQGIVGDPNPDWLAGFQNTFSFKGFSLSGLLDIRRGGDIWNGTRGSMGNFGTSKESGDLRNVTGYVFDGVVADRNGRPTEVVNTTPVDFANPANPLNTNKWRRYGSLGLAEEYVEDGSWVRLRELTLSYNLPSGLLGKTFSGARVSLYGRNVFLITNYKGVDPETNLSGDSNAVGWDYFNLPNTRSFGASLQITL